VNPILHFAFRQRYRLSGDPVYENPFAPWTEDDLYPPLDPEDDLGAAGPWDFPECEDIYLWLESLEGNYWPILFLIEQCCHDGGLLDLELRERRLSKFPLDAAIACEQAIASVPAEIAESLFFTIYWAVRIERARRRGRP
jgi:hypothetical protein